LFDGSGLVEGCGSVAGSGSIEDPWLG